MLNEVRILRPAKDGLKLVRTVTSAEITAQHWRKVMNEGEHEWNSRILINGKRKRNRQIICRNCGESAMMASARAIFCSGKCQIKYSR